VRKTGQNQSMHPGLNGTHLGLGDNYQKPAAETTQVTKKEWQRKTKNKCSEVLRGGPDIAGKMCCLEGTRLGVNGSTKPRCKGGTKPKLILAGNLCCNGKKGVRGGGQTRGKKNLKKGPKKEKKNP